jgi:aspartate ammonia-lyase
VLGHDQLIAQAAGLGNLELNHLMPLIADKWLESIQLAQRACRSLARDGIAFLVANQARCAAQVDGASATLTALLPVLGYEQASLVAKEAHARGCSIRELVVEAGLVSEEEFCRLVAPEAVTRLGSPEPRREPSPRIEATPETGEDPQ